jgi:hypothetical protein
MHISFILLTFSHINGYAKVVTEVTLVIHIPHLPQQCHNSKCVIFLGDTFKGFEVL